VFSSGFSEVGGEGLARERDLKAAIQDSGVRVLGPNCLGLINAFERQPVGVPLCANLCIGPRNGGADSCVLRAGTATGAGAASWAQFPVLSIPEMRSTLNFVDVMRECWRDPNIKVGAGYIEGVKDGRGLLNWRRMRSKSASRSSSPKRLHAPARGIAPHTGLLAGADAVFDGAIRRMNQPRARDEQLLDFVEAF
jgi:acetyltransferase